VSGVVNYYIHFPPFLHRILSINDHKRLFPPFRMNQAGEELPQEKKLSNPAMDAENRSQLSKKHLLNKHLSES
jgi:hypothetical protein